MNRKLALARLAAEIAAKSDAAAAQSEATLWAGHDQLERGNPIRIFEGDAFREKRK